MTRFEDPTRLRDMIDGVEDGSHSAESDSVRQILRAFQADAPDAASMQRMREALSMRMGASASPSTATMTFGRFAMLVKAKAGLGLLLLAAAGAVVWRSVGPAPEPRRSVATAPTHDAAAARAADASGRATASESSPQPSAAAVEAVAPGQTTGQTTGPTFRQRSRAETTRHSAKSRPHFARRNSAHPIEAVVAAGQVDDAMPLAPSRAMESSDVSSKAESVQAPRLDAPAPQKTAVQTPASENRPPALDEPSLLQVARKRASSEPEVTLQLLAEHARRFPSGALVQEREVLAIQVLRELGRRREADTRLAAFAHRFPDSVYLSQLR